MPKFHVEFDVEGTQIADIPLDYQLVKDSVFVGFEPHDFHGADAGDCKVTNLKIARR